MGIIFWPLGEKARTYRKNVFCVCELRAKADRNTSNVRSPLSSCLGISTFGRRECLGRRQEAGPAVECIMTGYYEYSVPGTKHECAKPNMYRRPQVSYLYFYMAPQVHRFEAGSVPPRVNTTGTKYFVVSLLCVARASIGSLQRLVIVRLSQLPPRIAGMPRERWRSRRVSAGRMEDKGTANTSVPKNTKFDIRFLSSHKRRQVFGKFLMVEHTSSRRRRTPTYSVHENKSHVAAVSGPACWH